jgi:hypothetical protein
MNSSLTCIFTQLACSRQVTGLDRNRWDYITQKGVEKTAIDSFSLLEFFDDFFWYFQHLRYNNQIQVFLLPLLRHGCMYYKVDYKTSFQDDSNEEFIILSHIVQKL